MNARADLALPPSSSPGPAELIEHLEVGLRAELELEPLALPPYLLGPRGKWRGAPVQLEARAYRGPTVAYARFVVLRASTLEIGNVLCIGHDALALPILGVDLVDLRGPTAVAVADLSPLHPEPGERARQLTSIALAAPLQSLPRDPGPLPSWCDRWFGPQYLFTRCARDSLASLRPTLMSYAIATRALHSSAVATPSLRGAIETRRQEYLRDHREHDRGLALLSKIFRPDDAERLIAELLFPSDASPFAPAKEAA